jgi:hypothetical protein
VSSPDKAGHPRIDDDMHDGDPKDRDAPFPLGPFLRLCDPYDGKRGPEPCLRSDFDDADARAGGGQGWHGFFVIASVVCGFIALFWGLKAQLFGQKCPPVPTHGGAAYWLEVGFTGLALILVLWTLIRATQKTWLIERYKAEHLRLIKFRLLIEPSLWNGDTKDMREVQNDLETRRAKVAHAPRLLLEALAHSDALPDLPSTDSCRKVDPGQLRRLLDYYRRKRLDFQLRYFERKMGEKLSWLENSLWQPVFFFFGLGLSAVNLILESPWIQSSDETLTHSLVFGSLLLPFGWGAIRTLRGAHERLRNQARSHARYDSLAEIRRSLDLEVNRDPEHFDPTKIFGYLYLCEGLLAADQHEWLRLMTEAEAYG